MGKRHGGVVTFGVLGILFGLAGLAFNGLSLIMIVGLRAAAAGLDPEAAVALRAVTPAVVTSVVVSALTGVMVFVAGIGVFSYTPWARAGFLWAAVITLINRVAAFPLHFARPGAGAEADAVTTAANQGGAIIGDLGTMAFNVLVLWFFNRAVITSLFQPSASTPSTGPT